MRAENNVDEILKTDAQDESSKQDPADVLCKQSLETAGCKQREKMGFKMKLKIPVYRRNVIRTVWLGASFWALGFAVGQRGPSFLDLQIITRTDVEQASFFFTGGSIGYLVGSLIAGVIYDKLNKSLLLLLCVLGMGMATIVLPWCSIYGLMIAIHVLVAIFAGGLDTAGNAELVRIWGTDGEMAMQFIHFAFAFGGVIGPLVTEPFLAPNTEGSMNATNISITSSDPTVSPVNSTVITNVMDNSTARTIPLTTDVFYAYIISGIIILLIVIPLTMQLFSDRAQKRRQNHQDEKKDRKQPLPLHTFLFVQGSLCTFYLLYCCVEDTFAAFLSTFVVIQLSWSKTEGAQLSSVFWASFAVGRFVCIFAVYILTSAKLLMISCWALVISMLGFVFFSQYGIDIGIWMTTVLAGASMSAVFPTGFSWMEEELVRVTGRVASSILIASSSGTMINPIILGYLMQKLTPMWFSYLIFGESVLCLFVYIFLLALSRFYLKNHYQMSSVEAQEISIPTLQTNIPSDANETSTAVGHSDT